MARRFRFPLETLLRVRQLREREAKRKVATQRAEIARIDQLNETTWGRISAQRAALLEHQRGGLLDPRDLVRGRAWVAHLRATITQREAVRAEMTQKLEVLQSEFQAARKDTKIIEKLRERRLADHTRAQERREQAATDELAQQLHSFAPVSASAPTAKACRAGKPAGIDES